MLMVPAFGSGPANHGGHRGSESDRDHRGCQAHRGSSPAPDARPSRSEVRKVVQRKKPMIQEQVQHVPKARALGSDFKKAREVMVQQVPVQKVVQREAGAREKVGLEW